MSTKEGGNTVTSNGEADLFYDAVSTSSELAGSESTADLEAAGGNSFATNRTTTAAVAMKRTVLTYSDRNGLQMSAQQFNITNSTGSQILQRPLDPYDDFALSNKLNAITLSNSLELHHYVFHNDLEAIRSYVKRYEERAPDQLSDYLSIRDIHGNTPLHLAAMLGHLEAIKILTKHGAVVKARNKQLWTPLNEAISYGERDLIRPLLVKFESEVEVIIADSKPKIISALEDMLDFYVEIKWDFESWIPLVSRFLPSDVCKLYKSGRRLRLDCTLGDLAAKSASGSRSGESANGSGSSTSPFSWQRGDLTFLFDVEKVGDKNSIVFMDNKKRTFCYVDKKDDNVDGVDLDEMDIEKEIDMLLGREIIHIMLDTKQANFLPTQTGWFSKRDKIEEINGYQCQFYDVSNLYIVSKLRNEHLSEEEIKKREEKQKKIKEKMNKHGSGGHMKKSKSKQQQQANNTNNGDRESLDSGKSNNNNNNASADLDEVNLEDTIGGDGEDDDADYDDFDDFMVEHRPSLPPPPKTMVTWSEYITAEEARWPNLGRKMRCKESKKEFKAQLAMSQEFPLTINDLNNLLEALAPLAKFRKLKEFINVRLPPGFPVKIDIPIVHTVTAKVSFQNFKKNYKSDPLLFRIPPNYTEENIQDLLSKDNNNKLKDGQSTTNPTTTTATETTTTAATTTTTLNESSPTHF